MKHKNLSIIAFLAMFFVLTSAVSDDYFSGTWCIGDERLIITFSGKDSLYVSSLKDESIQGKGTYEIKDSTLIASVVNEELELRMGYRYKKKNKNTLRAKIIFLTVDGDSVNHPRRWMRMEKCNPETYQFSDDTTSESGEDSEEE
jgi:hypothetical protein